MSQRNERARFSVKLPDRSAGSPDWILIGRLALAAVLLILGAFVVKNNIIRIILLVLIQPRLNTILPATITARASTTRR